MDLSQAAARTFVSKFWSLLQPPESRARLLAAFLVVHLALTVPLAVLVADWDWFGWLGHLNLDGEGTAANLYSAILWGAVAALAAGQLFRPEATSKTPRWLWVLGWLSAALFAALVAVEELANVKDPFGRWGTLYPYLEALGLEDLPFTIRWVALLAAPFAPLAAAAAWVAYVSLRRQPALAMLAVLALALGVGAIVRDGLSDLYGTQVAWEMFIEDASELMAGAILAVVLVERLATGRGAAAEAGEHNRLRGGRWAALGAALALLAAIVPALLAEYEWEEAGTARPLFYAGPITQLEQPFQAQLDRLTRVKVWAYGDGIERGADEEGVPILARLTPWGADTPVYEARAEVRHDHSRPGTVDLEFTPIPDSGGQRYVLTIRALRETRPDVYLGLTGYVALPQGLVLVNGVPHKRHLAGSTHAVARGEGVVPDLLTRDRRRLPLIGDIVATVFLWVFATVATWRGLTGPKPRFWRGFVWPAVQQSVIITAGLAALAVVLLQVYSAMPRA
ncbi:MAG: hypothetical protein OXG33_03275 [Chloroflexi bacterium]|nr:hypothetical protein [Chloroflexota bacterium]